jgi:hypothetical protein
MTAQTFALIGLAILIAIVGVSGLLSVICDLIDASSYEKLRGKQLTHYITLDECRQIYGKSYQYCVATMDGVPLWVCKDLKSAQERLKQQQREYARNGNIMAMKIIKLSEVEL